LMGMLELV